MNVFYKPHPLGPTFILIALIPGLNNQVCDGQTTVDEPCDSLCGGAGCGKCGGISCLDGALSKAGEAVKSAEQADKLLREKDSEAQQILGKISQVCVISFSKSIPFEVYDHFGTNYQSILLKLSLKDYV